MIQNRTTLLISVCLAYTFALAGCAAKSEQTWGDLIINQGGSMVDIGVKWNEGKKLIQLGNDKIAEGRDNINEGNKLISKGNIEINEGNRMIEQGKKLIAESEALYGNKSQSINPAQNPKESIETFPLSE